MLLKDIPGFPDYQASDDGHIWSKKTGKFIRERIPGKSKYYMINLSIDHRCQTFQVHKLVAFAFIDNPDNYMVINHKNGNKFDNRPENLEWCTPKHNTEHAHKTGLVHPAKGLQTNNGHFEESDIREIFRLHEEGYTNSQIAFRYNVTKGAINCIINRKTYKWVKI